MVVTEETTTEALPVARYLNAILSRAIEARASDVHFEPFEREFKIRYRVDGTLVEMSPPPPRVGAALVSRIKVMARMDIAERRVPQDGRFQFFAKENAVDLRVSTLPTQYGESLVLRVLDRETMRLDLTKLGMPEEIFVAVNAVIHQPSGMLIVTGPTGSGKTTTLYACLNAINASGIKILTAEDPVEYELEGVQQVAIHEYIGLTFANLLRSFLRHDPDCILVGEIRDIETAQMAIQASLTGHTVFTTLHTNDAAGAIVRLLDMGVEPFLISASLEAVLAQRLVRNICGDCRTTHVPSRRALMELGLREETFYRGKGCEACYGTGFRGRLGIYELLNVTEPIRQLIYERAPAATLRQKAIELGMTTLRAHGAQRCMEGITTIEEILKYT